ncbi:MAG TPA: hypothetical protein VNR36_07530 [Pseudolysinimonas sp.]|nr:hypothetical protein [Pseudolysinimonas sp.]
MGVDPRYDPAFQRGFEGEVRLPETPAGAAAEPPADPVAPPAQHPTGPASPPEPPRARALPLRELARNPFLLALSTLGAVLVIGGGAWANQARKLVETRGGAATELDYWFLRTSTIAVPLMIAAGVLIIAGVLFVAAVAWNRRQSAD